MSAQSALVTLLVSDMPRAKVFYTNLLGFNQ